MLRTTELDKKTVDVYQQGDEYTALSYGTFQSFYCPKINNSKYYQEVQA